ncbi:hypothetical protein COCON_G00040230 [Conger conger]|uniref:Uncharacterized protein n=1 Tax=Conger conger TaxID=82655 RepID=A0A9Q1I3T4_CONCO|nr:hypothetical protein COCON_G00040230 [Conger conger]
MVSSPIAVHPLDASGGSSPASSAVLTSFATSITGSPAYLSGPAPVGTPSFSRQHFSPHPWSASTSCESPVPSVSSGGSSPLSVASAPPLVQAKPSCSSLQDRKVPPPIGTERLARIRQTGAVNPALLTSSYTAPVGQGGIWSFGVGSASGEGPGGFDWSLMMREVWGSDPMLAWLGDLTLRCGGSAEAMSGWSQPLLGAHVLQHQLSQHQPLEQDDTGIVAPSNAFHPAHPGQAHPANFMDFPKVSASRGNRVLQHPLRDAVVHVRRGDAPPPPMGEGPGAVYNGLHGPDPAWSPILKVIPNAADNPDPQQVWPGTWAPHVGNIHLNHVN